MKARTFVSLLLCLLLVASFMLPAFAADHEKDGLIVTAFAEGEDDGKTEGGNTGGTGGTGDTGNTGGTGGTGDTGNTGGTGGTGDTGNTGGTGGTGDTGNTGGSGDSGSGESGDNPGGGHDHTWEVIDSKKATCREAGYETRKCTVCGKIKTEAVPKTDHTYDSACDPDCNVCGETRTVKHTPSSAWSSDGKNHWHTCKACGAKVDVTGHTANKTWSRNAGGHWHVCTVCGEKVDIADHYPGPAATEDKDQICMTCGYLLTRALGHVHKYEDTLSFDATGHWYACEECDEKKDFEEHVYDNPCDPECNVCGYVTNNAHDYGGTMQYDEECHWGVCTLCGQEGDHLAHVPGDPATEDTPQICTVCGKVLVPPLNHVHEGEWTWDEETHTQTCSCGLVLEEGPHTWDEGVENPDGTVTYTCTQCGMERLEGEPKAAGAEFPWILIVGIVALVCALGAGVVLVIMLAKKPAGKYSR